ncbi:hypothetical protein ANCDUO_01338 [Ancylostoma duodenale]|uniref:CCDC92/74 N-terminal domain-containing protein n=1 Tax=Ancylostoma duodenale TaxID=51022 RepID=A0A0C2DEF8_9BILA|nr:hypothetical protein ANCDUO_01338 [Ancylostoma duodenale]
MVEFFCWKSLYESDLELRLREAIRQRDEQWRKHEREQITFLQNETAAMLRGLHKEIERLGHQLKGSHKACPISLQRRSQEGCASGDISKNGSWRAKTLRVDFFMIN